MDYETSEKYVLVAFALHNFDVSSVFKDGFLEGY